MKIVISSSDGTLDGVFDPRFGRAAHFLLVDSDTGEWEAHANEAMNAPGGAGVQAAQFVSDLGAEAAVSGNFGPKAHAALSAAGVRMFRAPAGERLSCREVLERFKQGALESVSGPTAPGHHGGGGFGMGGGGGRGMGGGGGRGRGRGGAG